MGEDTNVPYPGQFSNEFLPYWIGQQNCNMMLPGRDLGIYVTQTNIDILISDSYKSIKASSTLTCG